MEAAVRGLPRAAHRFHQPLDRRRSQRHQHHHRQAKRYNVWSREPSEKVTRVVACFRKLWFRLCT